MKKTGLMLMLCASLVLPSAAHAAPVHDTPATYNTNIEIEDGMTQPIYNMDDAIMEEVFIETSVDSDNNGELDRVNARIIRPGETENGLEVPAIYTMSPYNAGLNYPLEFYDVDKNLNAVDHPGKPLVTGAKNAAGLPGYLDDYFVPRGYAYISADSIGTGGSNGCATTGDYQEVEGTKAVIDWLNGNAKGYSEDGEEVTADWSTGNVGMTGVSYNGTLPNAVATTGVEGLKTIVPIAAISDWYDYYRSNGAVIAPGGYQGEDADVLAKAVLTRENPELCASVMEELTEGQDRETGDYNEFWDERNYINDIKNVEASVLVVHGLNDWNVKTEQFAQWWDALEEHDVPRKMWLHQYGHSDPYYIRQDEWMTTLNKWFDYWLYEVDNRIMDEPMVDIQREDLSWKTMTNWPAEDAKDTKLHFRADKETLGSLSFSQVPNSDKTKDTIIDDPTRTVETLVEDLEGNQENLAVYLTEPLEEEMRLSGVPEVSLRAGLDAPTANLTALLVDYSGEETEIITRGWMDPQNINSDWKAKSLSPGKKYTFQWDLQPDDYIFKAGHQLGVVIISTDYDYTLRPEGGTTITIDPASSYIKLPLVK
ncbi:Xaa-Pro dipeptidyl-peptidase [Thalassobacillus devorans]|uniref:Xaa-Pro dipeptidyl-peptidase n=1 Tax=Thalassobacillus devorans TaxID=279813 RepID=A0ABQ1PFJ4_9BACI|nr:Xaa-Pro dipeptidyl-peptidase [Thalassobacillus devorans]NIK29383.1 X-Pro dipeptidyl-peptidase [Thalassobacillus devorans]GGC96254.1 Xaa-Pro dipeptidyl-peptidase [Thalassobacillus devorans]